MARLPDWLLRHTVTVEPYTGPGAYGDTYGSPVSVRALVEQRRRLVRTVDGTEAVSGTTVYAQLDALAQVPARSRVTLPTGITSKVITASRYDGGGLPTPDHWEISLE